ncbi:MAG: hypothetical protein HOW73_29430 [Polyangiaceae bacterium]|nr:hypothetical protein [Polyangiaceae bacterium]
MGRRVLQGEPGRFSAELDGVPARGFEWTDGICDILSYFAQSPRGDLVELIVACDLRAPGAPAAIADVARMILSRFRWKR